MDIVDIDKEARHFLYGPGEFILGELNVENHIENIFHFKIDFFHVSYQSFLKNGQCPTVFLKKNWWRRPTRPPPKKKIYGVALPALPP